MLATLVPASHLSRARRMPPVTAREMFTCTHATRKDAQCVRHCGAISQSAAASSRRLRPMRTMTHLLGLVPPLVIIALPIENRAPTKRYPFGYFRVVSIAFLVTSVLLTLTGV